MHPAAESSPIAVRFRQSGFLCPMRVFSPAEVAEYRAALDDLDRTCGPRNRFQQTHRYFGWAFEIVTHAAVLDLVEQVLGHEIVAWGSLVLKKPPDHKSFVPWHQDGAYRPELEPGRAVSAWIALTDSRALHGCMRVIPGSHHSVLPHAPIHDQTSLLKRGQEIAPEVKTAVGEEDAVDLELYAGEMSLHDLNAIHSSGPNRSNAERVGFIVRYAAAQRDLPVPASEALKVRGAGITSRNDIARPRATISLEDSYEAYRRYLADLPI
jgi:non-haem Fe2+, alpha-ketoglutarate-dependent halogenase